MKDNDARPSARTRRDDPNVLAAAPAERRSSGSAALLRGLGVLVVVVGLAIVIVHATKPGHVAAATTKKTVIHFSVGIETCTFVDATRSTENFAAGTDTAGRTLVTTVRYPTISPVPGDAETPSAPPAKRHGPFPLIVFAPGYSTTPATYSALLDAWVKAGIVVAAPVFPDTSAVAIERQGGIDTEADIVNQPADVGFVAKRLTLAAGSGEGCGIVKGLIDPDEVGLAGQSDGADTVAALAFESHYAYVGLHFAATAVLSGELLPPTTPAVNHETATSPLLVVQSATDACNPPQFSTALYTAVPESDKWFLTLSSGFHLPPYTGTADISDFHLVSSVTTTFFSDEFAHRAPGASMRALGRASASVGRVSIGPAPALAPLPERTAACYES